MRLKETLKKNNHAIKEQFDTISYWQKEVIAVCDNHKKKFLETKELMYKLKNENDRLRVSYLIFYIVLLFEATI